MGTFVGRLIGAIMVLGAIAVAVFPRTAIFALSTPVVLVTAIAVVVVALLAPAPRWLVQVAAARWTAPAVALSGGAIGMATGELLRYPYGWDAAVIMSIAHTANTGASLPAFRYRYLSLYPNNFPLLAIDRLSDGLGSSLGLSADAVGIALNGVCLTATLWLTFAVVRRAAGPVQGLLAAGFVMWFVGFSPWMAVPYTDLYAMPFLVGVPAAAQRAWAARHGRRALAWWVLAGASGGVAYLIKTTPAVMVVALVLTALLVPSTWGQTRARSTGQHGHPAQRWAPGLRTVAVVLAVLAGFFGTSAVGTVAAQSSSGVDLTRVHTEQSPPILWWVANGMNETRVDGRTWWGAYNRSMVNVIAGRTQADMNAYAHSYIAARWHERGLGGMAGFYLNKTAWNWSDASFWAWGEGDDSQQQPLATKAVAGGLAATLASAVSQVNVPRGRDYRVRMSVTQGLWIAMLFLGGLGLLRSPVTRDLLLLALGTVGIGAFIVVFQGRSRYLLTFVPIIAALCCAGMPWVPRRQRGESLRNMGSGSHR